MDKNILFKSLLQGVAVIVIVALLLSIVKDDSFLEVLAEPYTILMGIVAAAGSYSGFLRKEKRSEEKALTNQN